MKIFGLDDYQTKKGRKDHEKYKFFKQQYDLWTKAATVAIAPPTAGEPAIAQPEPQPISEAVLTASLIESGLVFTPEN
jgi:pyridoxine/pyridoxamine 5'-phosphate oxidase